MTWIVIRSNIQHFLISNLKLIIDNSQFVFGINLYQIKIMEVIHLSLFNIFEANKAAEILNPQVRILVPL